MECGFPDGWGELDEIWGYGIGYGNEAGNGGWARLEDSVPIEVLVADWADRGRRAGWDDWVQNYCEADVARCAEGQ